MRAEGVHRLILNARLFKEMEMEVVFGKNLRIGIFENENRTAVTVLFRGKNANEIELLKQFIDEQIELMNKNMH
jgi:hypothetical protein